MNTSRRLRRICCWMLLAALALGPESSWAFNPGVHYNVSAEALPSIEHDAGEGPRKFRPAAMLEIIQANQAVDNPPYFFFNSFHFCDERLGDGSRYLMNLKRDLISDLDRESPNGEMARIRLGTALHLLQDFYAHSNWVEMGNGSPEERLGQSIIPDPLAITPHCPVDPGTPGGRGLAELTTTYYDFPSLGCDVPPGKCAHGHHGFPLLGKAPCPGIAKDDSRHPRHESARSVAVEATRRYIESILNSPEISDNDDAVRALMGITGTMGFVIDDTGSMGVEINAVKAIVSGIIDSLAFLDLEPDEYLLERFGDPDVGPVFKTDDAHALLAQVDALEANGGGDCPEMSQEALLEALNASKSNSVLFVFTDASAKADSEADKLRKANEVNALAQEKRIKIIHLTTGSCSPVDPAYIRNAEETGGQLFFLRPNELLRTLDLIKPFLTGDFVTLLQSRGNLPSGSARSFSVPVDSTVSRAVFSLSIDVKGTTTLLRPSGAPVVGGTPGVTITELSTGTILTVEDPEPGRWQIRFTGSGEFSLGVRGNSPLSLHDFDFVEPSGDAVRGGLFPIAGQPIAGRVHTAEANVIGEVGSAEIRLLDPFGETIGDEDFAPTLSGAGLAQLTGEVSLPAGPFRVAIHGLDAEGHEYQRIFPTLFRGRSVEVRVEPATVPVELIPGRTATLRFVVKNFGSPGTFRIQAAESNGFVSRVQPSQLSLETDGSGTVEVDVTVAEGTSGETPVALVTTATSTADPSVSNSAALQMLTGGNQPPDCGSAAGRRLELWPPNHKMQDFDLLSVTGITDPDGDPVQVTADAITQDEPVQGLGDGDTSPDATGRGTGSVSLRAERAGDGNGRVYRIGYTASDGRGGSCQGSLQVDVPHDRGGSPAVDDGQAFDSTQP